MRSDEVSTSIGISGDESEWTIYSDDRKILTKLKNIGAVSYKQNSNGGYWFKIAYGQLSFRSPSKERKPLTEEQKKAASERMKKVNENKE